MVGLGVKTVAVRNVHLQGSLISTGNKLDLALTGNGWFQIEGADGKRSTTRAGAFNTNATGQLVTVDGFTVSPAMVVPENTRGGGRQQVRPGLRPLADQQELQELGQITLANFANEAGLEPLGDNLFQETTASGPADRGRARRSRLRHRCSRAISKPRTSIR
jgi:flagellar basal-body rod protein FlgG